MKARFSTDTTGSFLVLHVDDWEFYLEQVEGYQDQIEMVEAIKDACESYLEELSQEIMNVRDIVDELNIRHAAEMAGLEAQIEQNAILGAANIIEAERKKWVEEVRKELKEWYGHENAGEILDTLPSLQENDDNSNP